MKTQLLSKATKECLDEELFKYNSIAKEIAKRKVEIQTEYKEDTNIGGSRGSYISKPVEQLVMKYENDPRIKYLQNLQRNVEECYKILSEEQKFIFEKRWLLDEDNTWEVIADEMNLSMKNFNLKKDKILERYARVKGVI